MANDLKNLVKKVFEIDSYKSKIDDDQDVVVLSFTVDHEDAAKDLENFIEMGYDFVLDADTSPGETENGTYIVFVELERGRKVAEQIYEILEGIKKFESAKQFTSWLRLAPNNKISGGKVLSHHIPKGSSRLKLAFRNAANAIGQLKEGHLVDFFKRIAYSSFASCLAFSICFSICFSTIVSSTMCSSGFLHPPVSSMTYFFSFSKTTERTSLVFRYPNLFFFFLPLFSTIK